VETFVLTTRRKKTGRLTLVLEMRAAQPSGRAVVVDKWEVELAGQADKALMVLEAAEQCGALVNAEKPERFARFGGGRKEFLDLLHQCCGFGFACTAGFPGIGEWALLHRDGMRLAMVFALAGRCNTVSKRRVAAEGVARLPEEVVLYWFTLCFYGQRQKAGKAALFTFLTHKG
jgi:hypothetical protein